jgi:15-cis-phytoene synthase
LSAKDSKKKPLEKMKKASDPIKDNSLKTNAKSFFWGTLFMPRGMVRQIETLYVFLREVDDIVDDASKTAEERSLGLDSIREEIRDAKSRRPHIQAFLDLMKSQQIESEILTEFLEGMETDIQGVRFKEDADLFLYGYRVAGVVGQMMFRLLQVRERELEKNAVHLGIAMQLTNICRDVQEDALRGRLYLPLSRLPDADGPVTQLVKQGFPNPNVFSTVQDLIRISEEYYVRGMAGISGIPWRARFGILLAARLYRAIGRKILRRGPSALRSRTMVSRIEKVFHLFIALGQFLFVFGKQSPDMGRQVPSSDPLTGAPRPQIWLLD